LSIEIGSRRSVLMFEHSALRRFSASDEESGLRARRSLTPVLANVS
jgi:hypothetical protein